MSRDYESKKRLKRAAALNEIIIFSMISLPPDICNLSRNISIPLNKILWERTFAVAPSPPYFLDIFQQYLPPQRKIVDHFPVSSKIVSAPKVRNLEVERIPTPIPNGPELHLFRILRLHHSTPLLISQSKVESKVAKFD